MRGENRSTRGKTSHDRVEDQQTQSTYDTEFLQLNEWDFIWTADRNNFNVIDLRNSRESKTHIMPSCQLVW